MIEDTTQPDTDAADETTQAPAAEEPAGELDPIEAALRGALPAHTFYQSKTERLVKPPAALLGKLNEMLTHAFGEDGRIQVGADGRVQVGVEVGHAEGCNHGLWTMNAVWSTPAGVWQVLAGRPLEDTTYHVEVDGPDAKWERADATVEQTLALLRAMQAIN